MITFADEHTKAIVRSMWKTCFGDSDEYMDIHFGRKYRNENTLILSDPHPAASLQMLPYEITFYNHPIPFSYISGACTLPESRKKGYMEQLLIRSFETMRKRNIPLSILIPAEDWLFVFYEKYGYSQCFEKGEPPLKLKEILERNHFDFPKSYLDFQFIYSKLDFCVQKTEADFQTLVFENELDNFPDEQNQAAMVRIIDAKQLLSIFAQFYSEKSFVISVTDKLLLENNRTFEIKKGRCIKTTSSPDFSVSIETLAQLLFGFDVQSFDKPFTDLFESHRPIINLMY